MAEVRSKCGYVVAHDLHDCYNMLRSLQHRGKDAAGIAAISNSRIDVVKWLGRINRFSLGVLHHYFSDPDYHTFFGHCRYATRGSKDTEALLLDAHPHVIGGTVTNNGNHIIIRECKAAIVHNGQVHPSFTQGIDETKLYSGSDAERILHYYTQHGEEALMRNIPGSFSMAIADIGNVIVMRDRHGIMPGVLGEKDNKFVVASETVAFDENGTGFHEDLRLGTVYYLTPEGGFRVNRNVVAVDSKLCYFQNNYIGHESSVMDGVSNRILRRNLGFQLAEQFKNIDLDYVTYVPDCPEQAAIAFSSVLNVPFINLYYKVVPDRSFQEPTQKKRLDNLEKNLHIFDVIVERANKKPIDLEGKVLGIFDDSIVRGTVIVNALKPLKRLGVKRVHFLVYTPPIGSQEGVGCEYGVDMPPDDDFIARGRTEAEVSHIVSEEAGFPVLIHYLHDSKMFDVFASMGRSRDSLCTRCLDGKKPIR
jgi:amidophosphoribosyltransferase